MTLTEARKTLERYRSRAELDGELKEAIDVVMPMLPNRTRRPSAIARVRDIRERIQEAEGIDPFMAKSRDRDMVCWRQCVWRQMRGEGYTLMEIGKASGYNHATVLMGIRCLSEYIETGDRIAADISRRFAELMSEEEG